MITDPWQHILHSIQPAYTEFKDMLSRGPQYVPVLTRVSNLVDNSPWKLEIEEQWPDGIPYGTDASGLELVLRRKWCQEQLLAWEQVSQLTNPHSWYFNYRHDAEKFITLYYLKWQ